MQLKRWVLLNLELKLVIRIADSFLQNTINKGIIQTLEYSDFVGTKESHLIIFNRDKNVKWEDKIWHREDNSGVVIWGA